MQVGSVLCIANLPVMGGQNCICGSTEQLAMVKSMAFWFSFIMFEAIIMLKDAQERSKNGVSGNFHASVYS